MVGRYLALISTAALVLPLVVSSPWAQEREPAWEIFAEPEQPDGTTYDLDDFDIPKPKYSLDELVEPPSTDPDVYIRFSAGAKSQPAAPLPEGASAETQPPAESPFSPVLETVEKGEDISLPSGFAEDASGYTPLHAVEAQIPIVRTYQDYRKALENRTPEILFEGKRWVFSEAQGKYVDPLAAALEEARRAQQDTTAWSAEYIEGATGVSPFGTSVVDPFLFDLEEANAVRPDSRGSPIWRETDGYRLYGVQRRSYRENLGAEPLPNPRDGYRLRSTRSRARRR
jgi:hypothetical protein